MCNGITAIKTDATTRQSKQNISKNTNSTFIILTFDGNIHF